MFGARSNPGDAAFASFAKEFELSGRTYRPETMTSLASDDHTVALMQVRAERDGKKLAIRDRQART